MELLCILFLLHIVEGLVQLPDGAVAFSLGRVVHWKPAAAGLATLPLRPGALALLAAPLPLAVEDGGVRSTAPVGRLGLPVFAALSKPWRRDALTPVEVRDRLVRAGGRAFARTLSEVHARALAARLQALARSCDGGTRSTAVSDDAAQPGAMAALGARIAAARAALRWPARLCDAYAAALFVALPAALAFADENLVLLAALPALGVLHVAAVALTAIAQRSLLTGEPALRRRALVAAALFPPALLRWPQRTLLAAAGVAHPHAAATALLDAEARTAYLRRALAQAEHDGGDPRAIVALATAAGVPEDALRRPRPRTDAASAVYCPACEADYRAGVARCSDCGLALLAYAG